MILDAKGKKIKPKKRTIEAVVFVSDDAESWTPLKNQDVPRTIKAPDIMGMMLAGEIIETVAEKFYRAERIH